MKKQHFFKILSLFTMVHALFLFGCFDNSLTFQIRFPEVSGLTQGDRVYFGRNDIGQVETVTYTNQGDYLVEVKVNAEFTNATTEDSKFYIEQNPVNTSAMAVIVEQDRPGGPILKKDSMILGSIRPGYLNNILEGMKKHAGQAEKQLTESLEGIKKSLNSTTERLDKDLEATIEDFSSRLDSFTDEISKLPDSQEVQKLEESFRRFSDEFQTAQKDVQDYLRNEILPKIRIELDQLREKLKQEGREQEIEKLDNQVTNLEMI
ncbi:MAG: MCE family protein [Desulfofustis sp.]|nr:MCE family protein [Desulfofustis sp.]